MLSAGSHLQYLGVADLKVKADRITSFESHLISLDQPPLDYQSSLKPFLEETIGELERSLSQEAGILPYPFEVNKFRITQGSFWVANALLAAYPQADLAMINNGGLRKHLPAGSVTLRDLHEYIPFGNTVAFFSCYGRDILRAQEKNYQIAAEKPYDIISVSSPSWFAEQSAGFVIGDEQIQPDQLYRVVTHDYIISQWDKYLGFKPLDIDEAGDLFLDAIIGQVKQQFGASN